MSKKTLQKKNEKDIEKVVGQYEDYPYPMRNPLDEKKRLLRVEGDFLEEINHWLFQGKENFESKFRVLIAGGGTGDSTIFLAEQLKNTNAEIVYLDFSMASMTIAKQRAKIRGLRNIKWIHDSIFNIPNLGLGTFDFINCCGVLHHLPSPSDGLKILQESLTSSGGMDIMVYGTYGRTGVYHVQKLMQIVNRGLNSRKKEIRNAWYVIKALPGTNWFKKEPESLSHTVNNGDEELYDLLLHKQDRSYTIPQLYEFIESAGLNLVTFTSINDRLALRIENYITDTELLHRIKQMDIRKQQAIAELIAGNIFKHSIYVSKRKDSVASWKEMDNIPHFSNSKNWFNQMIDKIAVSPPGSWAALTMSAEMIPEINLQIPVSKYTLSVFKQMQSGTMALGEIYRAVKAELKDDLSLEAFEKELNKYCPMFVEIGVLCLRHKSVSMFPVV